MDKLYEIVDVSDNEIYYSIGLFETYEEAKQSVFEHDERYPLAEYVDWDEEKFEIREREFGLHGNIKTLCRIKRTKVLDKEKWKTKITYERKR